MTRPSCTLCCLRCIPRCLSLCKHIINMSTCGIFLWKIWNCKLPFLFRIPYDRFYKHSFIPFTLATIQIYHQFWWSFPINIITVIPYFFSRHRYRLCCYLQIGIQICRFRLFVSSNLLITTYCLVWPHSHSGLRFEGFLWQLYHTRRCDWYWWI